MPVFPGAEGSARPRVAVAEAVMVYVLFASLWIALSDAAVAWLVADADSRLLVGTFKGWAFVGVTAVLLYGLVRRLIDRQLQAFARERAALQAQADTLRLLHTLSESSPDAIFAKDRQGCYLLFNREAARVTGRAPGQVLGQDDGAIFPPEQAALLRANDTRVMALDRPETFEEELDTADGRVTFLATKGPLHDAEGRVVGLFGISRDITRRRELERQRQAAHDLLRDVLARVDDGFVALDAQWHYTYLNAQAARMLGRDDPQDLIGRHIWTEFPDGVGQPFHRAYEKAMTTQQPVVFEDHYAPWDRWFENRVYPSPDGLSIYFSDITERHRALQALRLSEQRYRLAAARGQVWDWDGTSGRIDIAPEFWLQLGVLVPVADQALMCFEALVHPEDLPRWRVALREHLVGRVPYDLEFRARHADGSWRWFHTQGQAVWDADGRAIYMAGTTFDITERERAAQALRESEAYRRSLFEQLGDAVMLIDRTNRVRDANPQALTMLGYTRDELLHLSVHDLLADFECPRLDQEVPEMMGGRPHLAEWEHVRKDGSHFPAEVSARLLDGQRYVAVVRDISARRAAEKALLTYQLELSELTQRLLSQEKTTTRRVAQALHDQLGQTLAVARLNLDAAVMTAGASLPAALKQPCVRLASLLDQAVHEVRQVLADLRPPLLEEQGLAAALDNEIRSRTVAGDPADVLLETTEATSAQRWPADVEYSAFMVAREAVANARQHAGATLIRVLLDGDASALRLDIIDDGGGIPPPLAHGRPGHLGIVGMRERAIAIGARFAVLPAAAGGTEVTLRWEANRA